jgi:lysophospholipase L1-like esterase
MSYRCFSSLSVGFIALALVGCGGSPTSPAPVPPPVSDPPKITCPVPATVQSTDDNPTVVAYGSATVVNGTLPVVTNCTPPSGSRFPLGQSAVACTATDAIQRTDSCSFLVKVLPVPVLGAKSFVAFGDSITWGEDGVAGPAISALASLVVRQSPQRVQVPISETYPEVLHQDLLQRYLKQVPSVTNAGRPGEAVTDSATFRRFVSLTASGRYDVVLIMEGSNDLDGRDDRNEPAVIAGLEQMILDAKSRGIRPYLATVPPMNPVGYRGLGSSRVPGFNTKVRALAASEGVTLVDVHQALVIDVPTYIGADGLHPTPRGYAKIADVFFAAIEHTLETTAPMPAAFPTIGTQAKPSVTPPVRRSRETVLGPRW